MIGENKSNLLMAINLHFSKVTTAFQFALALNIAEIKD